MSIHDARVPVTCDSEGCHEEIDVEPEFTYPDRSGTGGSYDTRNESIEELVRAEGWNVLEDGEEGHRHYCEGCAEEIAS